MIKIGIKKIKPEIKEKFDFPVLSLHERSVKHETYKMSFNKAALAILGYDKDSRIVFGRNEDNKIIFFDGKELSSDYDSMKNVFFETSTSIASKTDYDEIVKEFDLEFEDGIGELQIGIGEEDDTYGLISKLEEMPKPSISIGIKSNIERSANPEIDDFLNSKDV